MALVQKENYRKQLKEKGAKNHKSKRNKCQIKMQSEFSRFHQKKRKWKRKIIIIIHDNFS